MSFLGFGSSAASKASPYLNQIPGVAHQTLDPYIQQGQQADQNLNPHYDRLMNDPYGYLNEILSNYKPSAGYDFKAKNLMDVGHNAAAAGGIAGGDFDVGNQTALINSLLGDDMQQYLNNVMGIQGQGVAGQQGLSERGFNASNDLGSALAGNLQSQGTMAFQGQQQKDSDLYSLLGNVISGGAYAAPQLINLFGGGNQQRNSTGGGYNQGAQGGFNGLPWQNRRY